MDVHGYLVGAATSRGPYADLPAWLATLGGCPFSRGVDRALWGGFHADRLGYAFVAGYDAALARLLANAGIAPRGATCLAATEKDGAHPRAIATRLEERGDGLVLNGEKTFATLATIADDMLVVASRGTEDGKNRLAIVRVARTTPGVTVARRADTPFAPEIPHAHVKLEDVAVSREDVLPGDGYDAWLKPFRTIEDVHVLASVVGYLAGAARAFAWDERRLAEIIALGMAIGDVAARDLTLPIVHVALAGLFESARRLVSSLEPEWAKAAPDERARFVRDMPLLLVAETARQKRTEAALRALRR